METALSLRHVVRQHDKDVKISGEQRLIWFVCGCAGREGWGWCGDGGGREGEVEEVNAEAGVDVGKLGVVV